MANSKIVRIPGAEAVSGPGSLRPVGPSVVADMSGLARGAQNLAGSLGRIVAEEREKQNTIDLAAADAFATREFLNMQNEFQEDGDYATFQERAEKGTQDITTQAAELIRDPEMRQRWVAMNETNRIRQVDGIGDLARAAANEAERVRFDQTLTDYSRILEDPNTPPEIREQTRKALAGTIDVAGATGLYSPAEQEKARQTFIVTAEQNLAINTADSLIRANPGSVSDLLGIEADPNDPLARGREFPVIAAPGVDVRNVDPGVLVRYEQLQNTFGQQLTIISGARPSERNAAAGGASDSQHLPENDSRAIDVDVSHLSKEERVRLIETASAMGFTGIGVYNNSLHFDTGGRRAWGPSHGSESVPGWAKEVIDRHTGRQIAEVPVGTARGVDPRFAALDYSQRAALFDKDQQEVERRNMEVRAGLQTTMENAPVAIARSGSYSGYMPNANDFVMAYGAQEGIARFEAFDASVQVAQDTFAMRTMSADEIAAIVEAATPTDTGDGAALQEKSYAALSSAAEATLKARADDPAGYVQSVYPAVANAWSNVGDDPASFKQAVVVTALAQEQLGMPPVLLPKAMAANTAAVFNDVNRADEERIGALTSVVMGTDRPEHQAAILQQLMDAGVPPQARAGMEALARGDGGAAQRLLMAATAAPETLNRALPGDIKPAEIDDEIQAQLFDVGGIGDVYYDMAFGSIENVNTATQDMALMSNSVKLRLLDGSAGGNLQRAIDLTVQDMFGDVQVVTGPTWGGRAGMKTLLPKDADQGAYQAGFDALLGQVGEALAADLRNDMGAPPDDGTQAAIADTAIANYVEQALAGGYFTNAGDDAFKFIDPNGRGPVLDAGGEPLLFTREQVLAATATTGAVAAQPIADRQTELDVGAPMTVDADGNFVRSE